MDTEKLRQLLRDLEAKQVSVDDVLNRLRHMPYEDLGYAQLDFHRDLRKGLPEVVFCQNKTIEQAVMIFNRLHQHHDRVMGTRVSPAMAEAIQAKFPHARFDSLSRLITIERSSLAPLPTGYPYAVVITGGTADLPIAEEAAQTLEFLGSRVERSYDVGVAGLHRLLDKRELLTSADVIISVAGMEGALTSVVAGLVSCPVIGVPTSVGYGASFNGLAALLAMLNSCAPGVVVVNIDNGFGAGQFAHLILHRLSKEKQ
jgi:NCAIR mutase (PurE)-related protein